MYRVVKSEEEGISIIARSAGTNNNDREVQRLLENEEKPVSCSC